MSSILQNHKLHLIVPALACPMQFGLSNVHNGELNNIISFLSITQTMVEVGYLGPRMCAEYLHKHLSALGTTKKDVPILDVGAGTGLGAQIVSLIFHTPFM